MSENNGKSHSPNVINIDLESDSNSQKIPTRNIAGTETKSITLGELADSIITKDFSPNPLLRPTLLPFPENLSNPNELWKYTSVRRTAVTSSGKDEMVGKTQVGRSTPDERNVIRITQPQSPRKSAGVYHEPISPPEGHFQQIDRRQISGSQLTSSSVEFQLDRYMSNKIVEAMRTSDEKIRQDEHNESRSQQQQQSSAQQQASSQGQQQLSHAKEIIDRSSTPGDMVIDDERTNCEQNQVNTTIQYSQHSHLPQTSTVTTFAPTTYTYPYSALNVVSGAAPLPTQGTISSTNKQSNSDLEQAPPPRPQPLPAEPKPLLSAQYEALSDED